MGGGWEEGGSRGGGHNPAPPKNATPRYNAGSCINISINRILMFLFFCFRSFCPPSLRGGSITMGLSVHHRSLGDRRPDDAPMGTWSWLFGVTPTPTGRECLRRSELL